MNFGFLVDGEPRVARTLVWSISAISRTVRARVARTVVLAVAIELAVVTLVRGILFLCRIDGKPFEVSGSFVESPAGTLVMPHGVGMVVSLVWGCLSSRLIGYLWGGTSVGREALLQHV